MTRALCLPVLVTVAALAAWAVAIDTRQAAPEFQAKTLDGQAITKSSLKGRYALIQFWTTWCGYCRRDQPAVEQIMKEISAGDLTVLCVSVKEARKKVADYIAQHPRSCKVIANEDTNLPAMFGIEGFPKYVVLDREGKIAGHQDGAGGIEALRDLLRRAGLR